MRRGRLVLVVFLAIVSVVGFNRFHPQTSAQKTPLTYKEDFYRQTFTERHPVFQDQGRRGVERILSFAENQVASFIKTDYSFSSPLLAVPFLPQEHALSCEAAALRMALAYYGAEVSEDELIQNLEFSAREKWDRIQNVWGDPEEGFVGSVDGSIFDGTGYGVYEKPIWDLANQYRSATILENPGLGEILTYVNIGHPVLVWGLLNSKEGLSWKTKIGKTVRAFPGEHVRVLIGYTGPTPDPNQIILMDPLYGEIRMETDKFLQGWDSLGRKTVVIN